MTEIAKKWSVFAIFLGLYWVTWPETLVCQRSTHFSHNIKNLRQKMKKCYAKRLRDPLCKPPLIICKIFNNVDNGLPKTYFKNDLVCGRSTWRALQRGSWMLRFSTNRVWEVCQIKLPQCRMHIKKISTPLNQCRLITITDAYKNKFLHAANQRSARPLIF